MRFLKVFNTPNFLAEKLRFQAPFLHLKKQQQTNKLDNRHLQILSGMERLEYVIVYWIVITKIKVILKKKVPQKATRLSKNSLKKINSTFETSLHNYASVAQWSERLTRMDLPMRVSWVRIPARELYSFFVGFSGFYFFPIFKNCLWQFVELFFSKSLLFL